MNFPVSSSNEEQTEGGRFDFDDGGSYVGDWCDAKAHGLGLVTGPRGQGQFSGQWENGFESCGVYIWPSGNTYEGQWLHGKRQGVGVERKGRWIYMGDWTTGFKGRYGVRQSTASGAKYEGAWNTGLQEGLGVETYADGGTFAGMWLHGTREGAGVRQSVPYGLACHYRDERCLRDSLTSMRSMDDDDGSIQDRQRKMDEARGGFVLTGRGDPNHAPIKKSPDKQRKFTKTNLLSKLRKPRSTGDINESSQRHNHHQRHFSGSIRSTISTNSQATEGSALTAPDTPLYWTEDIIDPSITERYMGHWKQDKRSGFGVSERSDGLMYLGEWMNNKKHGYGITYFPDGSHESGKYKMNVLVLSTAKRNKLFALRTSRLKERVSEAKMQAELAQNEAKKKESLAFQKQVTARESAQAANELAEIARQNSNMAQIKSREYAPEFYQPGDDYMKRREEAEDAGHMTSSVSNKSNHLKVNGTAAVRHTRAPTVVTHFEDNLLTAGDGRKPNMDCGNNVSSGTEGANLSFNNSLSPNVLCDGTLQVGGGGSRRGSFRRSVRRNSSNSHPVEDERKEIHEAPLMRQKRLGENNVEASVTSSPQRREMNKISISQNSNTKFSDLLNSSTLTDHFDQYSTMRRKRDSGLGRESSLDESTSGTSGATTLSNNNTINCAKDNVLLRRDSDTPDSGMSDISGASRGRSVASRNRRRTLPSVMTSPPVKPIVICTTTDEYMHSLENLKYDTASTTFIIENGIRKRVQAERNPLQQSTNRAKENAERRALGNGYVQQSAFFSADDDLQRLPRHYTIESQACLAKDLGEGSIPDVSVCRHIKQNNLMSREEVSKLSQARRQELFRQEQRRRQGEIVIRLADLKQNPCLPKNHEFRNFVAKRNSTHAAQLSCSSKSNDVASKPTSVIKNIATSVDPLTICSRTNLTTFRLVKNKEVISHADDHFACSYFSASQEALTFSSNISLFLILLATFLRYQLKRMSRQLLSLTVCQQLQDWCREHIVVLFVLCINTALALIFLFFLAAPKS